MVISNNECTGIIYSIPEPLPENMDYEEFLDQIVVNNVSIEAFVNMRIQIGL